MKYDIVCSTKNLSTEEWLKIRTLGIGGSDAGIIAGCNPYRSIFELWQEKRGEIPVREEESEVTHFGKVLEDVVRKEFIQRTGLMVRKTNSILRSKEYPFMIADVDKHRLQAGKTPFHFRVPVTPLYLPTLVEKHVYDPDNPPCTIRYLPKFIQRPSHVEQTDHTDNQLAHVIALIQ